MTEEKLRITLNDMAETDNRKFLRLLDPAEWDRIESELSNPKNTKSEEELIQETMNRR